MIKLLRINAFTTLIFKLQEIEIKIEIILHKI